MLRWKLCSLTIDTMVSLDISGTGTSLHMERNIRWSTWTCKQGSIRHGCRYVCWDSALLSQRISQLTSINWNSQASVIKQHQPPNIWVTCTSPDLTVNDAKNMSDYPMIPRLRNWVWWLSASRKVQQYDIAMVDFLHSGDERKLVLVSWWHDSAGLPRLGCALDCLWDAWRNGCFEAGLLQLLAIFLELYIFWTSLYSYQVVLEAFGFGLPNFRTANLGFEVLE